MFFVAIMYLTRKGDCFFLKIEYHKRKRYLLAFFVYFIMRVFFLSLFFLVTVSLGTFLFTRNVFAQECNGPNSYCTVGSVSVGCRTGWDATIQAMCTAGQICCAPKNQTSPSGGTSCAGGSGACKQSCDSQTEDPDYSGSTVCGTMQICCVPRSGTSPGGTTTTTSPLAGGNVVECPGVWRAGVCFPMTTGTGLSDAPVDFLLMRLMWWLLAMLGFIGIIAFVISGMQYLLAAGSESMIETAKRNIRYSIIGMVVALSGLVIIFAIDAWLSGNLISTCLFGVICF